MSGAPPAAIHSSPVIAALETAWAAIRDRHPDVEACLLITGKGSRGHEVTLGHYRPATWQAREGESRFAEVLISGERMHGGAEAVMQTLLHEASHSLAQVRGWSAVRITKATAASYSNVIAGIDRAMAATIPCGELTEKDEAEKKPVPSYDCACVPARKIRMARDVWTAGPITCGCCGFDFEEV